MNILIKSILTTVIIITVISIVVNGQTIISGGIYSDATLTKANSPYLAENVVVFPNVTLTIEPGVVITVTGNLEIRQATLIAEGTATDSITFIGRLPIAPWGDTLQSIIINFNNALTSRINYCIVKYIAMGSKFSFGIDARMNSSTDSLTIKNSYFTNNGIGIFYQGVGNVIITDSCLFKNNLIATTQTYGSITNCICRKNQYGFLQSGANIQNCIIDSNIIIGIEYYGSTINNCQIKNNGIGIKCFGGGAANSGIHNNIIENDSIGIQLSNAFGSDSIYCNKICNNTTYNVKATTTFNRNVANNYWCTNDSLTVANSIYDGYDNSSFGLVSFMPIDTAQCYSVTGIPIYEIQPLSFDVFPNPASEYLTIELPANNSKTDIKIFNMIGEEVYSLMLTGKQTRINVSTFAKGMYIVQTATGDNTARRKFIKE